MVSIVIPAHNEETTIGRCLSRLLGEGSSESLRVVVACNGCSDRTAEFARQFGDRVTVIETDVASKVYAMNLGDEASQGFPRFYMDADVVLSPTRLRRVAAREDDRRAPTRVRGIPGANQRLLSRAAPRSAHTATR